jgi:hypothetical protein
VGKNDPEIKGYDGYDGDGEREREIETVINDV